MKHLTTLGMIPVLAFACLPLSAQAPPITPLSQDIVSAISTLNQATATLNQALAAIPPAPVPDPVVVALQASLTINGTSLYASLAGCVSTAGCRILFAGWLCTVPAWQASTTYSFGDLVDDTAGNTWKLTGVPAMLPFISGVTIAWAAPSAGAVTSDNGLTWTFYSAAGITTVCTASAIASAK